MEIQKDFQNCLQALAACHSFELQSNVHASGQTDYYIPYMMNDALECYFILEDCHLKGTFISDIQDDLQFDFLFSEDASHALIIRQSNRNVCTLWFSRLQKILRCYQYHEIGHFWVSGQEQWRRLVYMVGTIYDKFSYMGDTFCNQTELMLLPLMEFAPFRYWSPIHESLDDIYSNTSDGILAMKYFCQKAGDTSFLKLLKLYEKFPSLFQKIVINALTHAKRIPLYETILNTVQEASSQYPSRIYDDVSYKKITDTREELTKQLLQDGFKGKYPYFHKKHTQIFVTEEHPFTILEWEHFHFKIQLMVSKTTSPFIGTSDGFFKKRGNSSQIYKYEFK